MNIAEFTPACGKNSPGQKIVVGVEYHRQDNCIHLGMTRVLLVEDSEDILDLLRIQLEWMGYIVDTATDGDTALGAAQHARPDVIISDLRMPGIDGFEFIRRVRRTGSLASVPAIALTGAGMDSDIQQAIASGFTAHLKKPVEASDLSKLIEQLTSRHAQRKAG